MKDSQVLCQLSFIRVSHFLGTSCVNAWSDTECKQFPYDMFHALQAGINLGCIFSGKFSFASSMRPDRLWVSACTSQSVDLNLWVLACGSQPVGHNQSPKIRPGVRHVEWNGRICPFPSNPQTKNTWIHNFTVPYALSCRDIWTFTFM